MCMDLALSTKKADKFQELTTNVKITDQLKVYLGQMSKQEYGEFIIYHKYRHKEDY